MNEFLLSTPPWDFSFCVLGVCTIFLRMSIAPFIHVLFLQALHGCALSFLKWCLIMKSFLYHLCYYKVYTIDLQRISFYCIYNCDVNIAKFISWICNAILHYSAKENLKTRLYVLRIVFYHNVFSPLGLNIVTWSRNWGKIHLKSFELFLHSDSYFRINEAIYKN